MSKPGKNEAFPWLLLLGLIATVYLFWVLPWQIGSSPPKAEFTNR